MRFHLYTGFSGNLRNKAIINMKNYSSSFAFVITFQLLKSQKLKVIYLFIKLQENTYHPEILRPQSPPPQTNKEINLKKPSKPTNLINNNFKSANWKPSFFPLWQVFCLAGVLEAQDMISLLGSTFPKNLLP